nr:T9SS type A sorting domain-containing protein [Saprospiraceae bacterium]
NVTKLNNTLTALDSLATYQWVDCDEDYKPVVNATQRSYTPVRSGNYGVILSSPPCSDTTVCIQVIVTHAFNEDGYRCMIYPNPASGKLYVKLPDRMTGDLILTICDIQGRELIQRSLARGGREFIEVDVSGWANGMYFVKIQFHDGAGRQMFFKI